jgi:hypothetical protein
VDYLEHSLRRRHLLPALRSRKLLPVLEKGGNMRPHRRYTIAGKRFEDALRVERDRQIAELRAENAALKQQIQELESQKLAGRLRDNFMEWPLSKFHELEEK